MGHVSYLLELAKRCYMFDLGYGGIKDAFLAAWMYFVWRFSVWLGVVLCVQSSC